ncbi:protein RALF-like 33 [Neltuma alba]|uniref:protein RALF-like 33 n=1 Tax=Neltuma alba TaxID=207710 RepID=UPI0010A3FB58|nr:protein RALF-like 33 [Prosopis alba]
MGTSRRSYGLVVMGTILAFHALVCSSATIDFGGLFPVKSECRGSTADCLLLENEGELFGSEFEMESEISRRILATSRYISYGALRRNTVPCSRRGASYYNCRPGAQANPYRRGCSAITRCRS